MRRYLYAVYDKDDFCIGAFETKKEVAIFLNISYPFININNQGDLYYKNKRYSVYKIDCLEIHNDIFKEEDEKFKEMYYIPTNETIANDNNISLRTYYNKKSAFKNRKKYTPPAIK